MISAFENRNDSSFTEECFRVYSLSLQHKHIVEIQKQSGLLHPPLFVPSVGRYRQGMIVQVPLPLFAITGHPSPADIYSVLRDHYKGKQFVSVSLIYTLLLSFESKIICFGSIFVILSITKACSS